VQRPDAASVALWRDPDTCLQVFRDRLGRQPIWFTHDSDHEVLCLSNDLAWLRQIRSQPLDVNPRRLVAFLSGLRGSEGDDFTSDIGYIPQHAWLSWSCGQAAVLLPHSDPWVDHYHAHPDLDVGAARAWNILGDVVDETATHPFTFMLSSGIDSGALLAATSAKSRDWPLSAISIVSNTFTSADESELIALAAAKHNVALTTWTVESLPQLVRFEDLTHHLVDLGAWGSSGGLVTWAFLKALREQLTYDVLWVGDGGDVMWSIPWTHQAWRRIHQLFRPTSSLSKLRQRGQVLSVLVRQRARVMLKARLPLIYQMWLASQHHQRTHDPPWASPLTWLTSDARALRDQYLTAPSLDRRPWESSGRGDFLAQWVHESIARQFLAFERLMDVSILSPLWHERLLSHALSLSPELLHAGDVPKRLLREALRGHYPEPILTQVKQHSMNKVIEHWLGVASYASILDAFSHSRLAALGLIHEARFLNAFRQYSARVRETHPNGPLVRSRAIWWTVVTEAWLRSLD